MSEIMKAIILPLLLSGIFSTTHLVASEEEYGRWELKNIDGPAALDPNAPGDNREAYFTKLESLEGGKLLSLRCRTFSTTRTDWYKIPSVKVKMHISDYNRNSGKIWNSKEMIVESNAIWGYLDNEGTFYYENRHTFETKGWKNAWRKAMGHCLSAYNIYIEEWNEKKGTSHKKVNTDLYR